MENKIVSDQKAPAFCIKWECGSCQSIFTTAFDSKLRDQKHQRICPMCKKANLVPLSIEHDNSDEARTFFNEQRNKLRQCYMNILALSEEFIDMKETDRKIKALWIIGSFVYRLFQTFPYLYFNAMRGSAKTRTENFIAALTETEVYTGITESGIFRHDADKPLIIDEAERVNKKDYEAIREFLNVAYKKGGMVKRHVKAKEGATEKYRVEKLDAFRPVVIANISGMDDVLNDRCLTCILEKSNREDVTKMLEIFKIDPRFQAVHSDLVQLVYLVQCSFTPEYMILWNNYIKNKHKTTLTTLYTYTTLTTLTTPIPTSQSPSLMGLINGGDYTPIFERIDRLGINSRNLELIFPLLLVAYFLGDDIFEEALNFLKESIQQKKDRESVEDRDVTVINFVATQCEQYRYNYGSIRNLVYKFKEFLGESSEEEMWLNDRWLGRALIRLNLIAQRRRVGQGIEVILAVDHAKQKMRLFRNEDLKDA